jgi:hypothetical protein
MLAHTISHLGSYSLSEQFAAAKDTNGASPENAQGRASRPSEASVTAPRNGRPVLD